MRMLSYQAKVRLKKILLALGILALVLLVVWLCWMVWLQRYIVFTRDGVVFDFGRSTLDLADKDAATAPSRQTMELNIQILEGEEAQARQAQGAQPIQGVYADTELLSGDFDLALENLSDLEPGTAVLLDVKSKFGNYYYTTGMQGAELSTAVDAGQMDALIRDLAGRDVYLIARVPAFRDSAFAQAHPDCGLALDSGVLWTDEEQCYWLDPASQTVVSNLVQLCRELRQLGFDEVVFTDFRIPDSGSIAYSAAASKEQVLRDAAQALVAACASDSFTVSFVGGAGFQLPAGRSRLYLEGIAPEQAADTAEKLSVADKAARLVFLTDTRDTRFEDYSVLRRIS